MLKQCTLYLLTVHINNALTLSKQRCRSVFNIGAGIILHFYRFSGFWNWGGGDRGYSGFADFSNLNDFENMGYIQVLTKIYSNNWKHVLESIKSINYVSTINSWLCIIIKFWKLKHWQPSKFTDRMIWSNGRRYDLRLIGFWATSRSYKLSPLKRIK